MRNRQTGEASITAERMAALGRLAGGVAHDLNNVLMVISGYADILAQAVDDEDGKDAVQTIQDAAQRAGTLTQQLLLFSRRQTIEAADVAIVPVVQSLENRLRRIVPDNVTLEVTGDDPRLTVRVDRGQFDHVVVSLVTNARDAMPEGGRLTVSVTGLRRGAFVDAAGDMAPAGDYVRLAVSNTGAGLTAAVQEHVFELYFTSTGLGKGAGLGLAAVYGIAKSSNGFVDVMSTVGGGTTFEVLFPLVGSAVGAGTALGVG